MIPFLVLNGVAVLGEATSAIIRGVKKVAVAITDGQAKSMLNKLKETM